MQRYAVNQVGGSTYQVVDLQEKREICVCSEFDEIVDAKKRADSIALLLNNNEYQNL
jgi:hypothetical protein